MPPNDNRDLSQRLFAIEASVKNVNDTLTELIHSLNGNGQPGIKTRLGILEDRIGNIIWLKRAAVIAIIGAIVSLGVQVVRHSGDSDRDSNQHRHSSQ